jgi:hypothetical protein
MNVRIRDLRAALRSVRTAIWRIRLRAEAVLAMGSLQSIRASMKARLHLCVGNNAIKAPA